MVNIGDHGTNDTSCSRTRINGIRLQLREAGHCDGRLVVLLHGFPENHLTWDIQIADLAEQGFHVYAPDQRGYGFSEKPTNVSDYHIDHLVQDISSLIQHSGRSNAIVIGHDWGAAVAWILAVRYPNLVSHLVAINGPHPHAMMRTMISNPAQIVRLWYTFAFQIPWLPELILCANDFYILARALRTSSRPGTFSNARLAWYRQAWKQTGAITAMVNWHRATFRRPPSNASGWRVSVPALVIWGTDDHFLCRELAGKSLSYCDRGKLEFIDGGTHWVHLEQPAYISGLLKEFLR